MDIPMIRNKLSIWIKKYRYVVIVLVAGILLMLIPSGEKGADASAPVKNVQEEHLLEVTEEQLKGILSQIKGAGKVEVLLTCATSERNVLYSDERISSSENSQTTERETVLITDGNRGEEPLVEQVIAPEYMGAVIVCQGASNPTVRLAISDAVSKATGLGLDRISVLMMK